jgi:hypothetical protein
MPYSEAKEVSTVQSTAPEQYKKKEKRKSRKQMLGKK